MTSTSKKGGIMKNHTGANIGKKVLIITKSGDIFVDKLLKKKSKYIELKERKRIKRIKIRSLSIYRAKNQNQTI